MKTFAYAISGNLTPKLRDAATCQALSRFGVVIVGLWNIQPDPLFVARIKTYNKACLVGQYTMLEESTIHVDSVDGDKASHLNSTHGWHLKDGKQVIGWGENCLTDMSPLYAKWLAGRDYVNWFRSGGFDFWYCDNVRQESLSDIPAETYQAGHRAHWEAIRTLAKTKIMGNAACDLSAYKGLLDGALFEGAMGAVWSLPNWHDVMARYRSLLANVKPGGVVGFQVQGASTDQQLMRFGLCSCLQDDGYFCFNDPADPMPPYFPVYDIDLGAPINKSYSVGAAFRRDYAKGSALVNPTEFPVIVPATGVYPGITVPARDGVILQTQSLVQKIIGVFK